MASPAEIIRQLLVDLALAADSGPWRAFVSFLPDSPDNAIVVYDTAGFPDGRYMQDGFRVEHPGIQILIRGPIFPDVWAKVNDIALKLDEQKLVSVAIDSNETYTLHNISRTGMILPLGMESEGDKRRHQFAVNAVITVKKG